MSLAAVYAKTLMDAGKNPNSKDFVEKTLAFMKAKGHLSLLPHIVKIIENTKNEEGGTVVTLAKESDSKKFSTAIKASLASLGVSGKHTERIDSRIVGGYSIRSGSHSIDNSFRNTLVSLYKDSTKS